MNSTLDLSELARIILRIVRDEVGIERGTVFVMAPQRNHLTSLAGQEVDTRIQVQVGSGIAGTGAENGEVIDIPDAYADDRFDQSFGRQACPLVFFRLWRILWMAADLYSRPPTETDFIWKGQKGAM